MKYDGGEGTIALEDEPVPNTALTTALKLDVTSLGANNVWHRQRRLLGHPRQAGHDVSRVVLRQGERGFKGR